MFGRVVMIALKLKMKAVFRVADADFPNVPCRLFFTSSRAYRYGRRSGILHIERKRTRQAGKKKRRKQTDKRIEVESNRKTE